MTDNETEKLIYKFFEKSLSDEEKIRLDNLLRLSEEARCFFQQQSQVNRNLEILKIDKEIKIRSSQNRIKYSKFTIKSIYKYAAILFVPILLGFFVWFFQNKSNFSDTVSMITYYNEKKESVVLILPDGSKARLYAYSELKYPNQFLSNERWVDLHGEATFEVVSDQKNPFYVRVKENIKIKAYGTKFHVSGYDRDETVRVYLEKGKVNFKTLGMDLPQEMNPSDLLEFNTRNHKLCVTTSSGDEFKAYEDGILLFKSEPLSRIINRLSDVYGVDITIINSAIEQYPITASFKNKSIEQIMDVLQLSTPGLQWKKDDNHITIFLSNLNKIREPMQ